MARQHTPPSGAVPRRTPIVERKVKPDGSVREYGCTLLELRRGLAVVEFVLTGGGAFATPVPIPPGSVSLGFFWARRPYNLYRMRAAGGEIVAHRFDAVTAVRLTASAITYRDLELDWWVLPDETIIEEDRAEYEALVRSRGLSLRDIAAAELATAQVYSRYRHIIDEAEAVERRLAPRPMG